MICLYIRPVPDDSKLINSNHLKSLPSAMVYHCKLLEKEATSFDYNRHTAGPVSRDTHSQL